MKQHTYAKVRIDGGLKSDLSWKEARKEAQQAVADHVPILWELDLGIFGGLRHPLVHNSQFLSLSLSIKHFRDTLWKEFGGNSVGAVLYQGPLDFTQDYPWDDVQEQNLQEWLEERFCLIDSLNQEVSGTYSSFSAINHTVLESSEAGMKVLQLYCRDTTADYLEMLAGQLPEEAVAYALVDARGIKDPVHLAHLLSKDKYPHINLKVDNSILKSDDASATAICLPTLEFFKPSEYGALSEAFELASYRVIPEELLITEWEELDYLIVSEAHMSPQGKRMLMGFCAAGGTVVTTGQSLNLPYEMPFGEFVDQAD